MKISFTKMLGVCCGLALLFTSQVGVMAQSCFNAPVFPSVPTDLNSATTGTNITGSYQTISTVSFTTEHSIIAGAIGGDDYLFEVRQGFDGSGAHKYITLRSDSANGPVVAAGASPLAYTASSSANLYAHWTEDAACNTQSISHRTRVLNASVATEDCLGVLGGLAQPGTPCDDGDPDTFNDTWTAECECEGSPATGNEVCSGAINLGCGATVVDSTTGAAPDVAPFCGTGDGTGGGRWYRFATATAQEIVVSTCSELSNFDTKIRVYSGSCGELNCVGGNDDAACSVGSGGVLSRVTFNAAPATLYYILVHGFGTAQGTYELSIECNDFECPGLGNIGASCDDGDPTTFGSVVTENCECVGTPFDCTALLANIGDSCDANGEVGEVNENCECVEVVFEGCTNGFQFGTVATNCDLSGGSTLGSWVEEYTVVTGVLTGIDYTFSATDGPATIPNFFITITDNDLNILAFGVNTVTYTATSAASLRFYTHSGPNCIGDVTGSLSSHTRVVDWDCTNAAFDCPLLGANFGDFCDFNGSFGEIDENCDCIELVFSGCTDGFQFGTVATNCALSSGQTTGSWVNEFTLVTGVETGFEYAFSVTGGPASIPVFYITITDELDNILAFGENVVNYTATSNGSLRFYTHSGPDCIGLVTGSASSHTRVVNWTCLFDCPALGLNIGASCDDGDPTTFDDTVTANCECVGTPYDCTELLANIGDPCILPADGLSPFTINVDSVTALGFPTTFAGNDSTFFEVPAGTDGIYNLTINVDGVAQNGSWASEFRVRITDANGINITQGAPGGLADEWQPSTLNAGGPIVGSLTLNELDVTPGNWIIEVRFTFNEGATINGIVDFEFDFQPVGEASTIGSDCECTPLEPVCNANGGTLSYSGSPSFCVGTGSPKGANVTVSGATGSLQRWGLFNSAGQLVDQRANNSQFNLDNFAPGNYTIRYMRYESDVNVSSITSLSSFSSLEGCWATASNNITVFLRPEPSAGTLTALSPTTFCANAGSQTGIQLGLSGFDAESRRYAIVSQALSNQVVLSQAGTASGATFNMNGLPAGTYRAVVVGYQQGTSLSGVEFQSQLTGCFDVSNTVTMSLTNCLSAELSSSPNPTPGQSFVTFSNPREERATLEVYDMSGRMVEQLFNQVTNPGQEYRLEFNGTRLPNGVYLYRLTTDTEVIVDKFMIAR